MNRLDDWSYKKPPEILSCESARRHFAELILDKEMDPELKGGLLGHLDTCDECTQMFAAQIELAFQSGKRARPKIKPLKFPAFLKPPCTDTLSWAEIKERVEKSGTQPSKELEVFNRLRSYLMRDTGSQAQLAGGSVPSPSFHTPAITLCEVNVVDANDDSHEPVLVQITAPPYVSAHGSFSMEIHTLDERVQRLRLYCIPCIAGEDIPLFFKGGEATPDDEHGGWRIAIGENDLPYQQEVELPLDSIRLEFHLPAKQSDHG